MNKKLGNFNSTNIIWDPMTCQQGTERTTKIWALSSWSWPLMRKKVSEGAVPIWRKGILPRLDGRVWGLRKGLLEAGTSREGWGAINEHNRQIKGGSVGHQKDQLEASHLGSRPASTNNLCKPSDLSSAHFSSPVIWDGQITSVDIIPRCA